MVSRLTWVPQAQARANTRGVRAATRSTGNREDTIEPLHGLIPRQIVARHEEVATMGTGQELRVIHHALVGVEWLRGSHGYLLAGVLPTLAELDGGFWAHDNPISLTGRLLRY